MSEPIMVTVVNPLDPGCGGGIKLLASVPSVPVNPGTGACATIRPHAPTDGKRYITGSGIDQGPDSSNNRRTREIHFSCAIGPVSGLYGYKGQIVRI